jgi:drug/metabolite transporter (DMT)-like permease
MAEPVLRSDMPKESRSAMPYLVLWVSLIVISGTWGSSFLLAKLISASMPPFAFAAARGFFAALALISWMAWQGLDFPRDRRSIRHMAVLGTTNGWLANALTAVAVSRIDSTVAGILQATVPLIVALMAPAFLGQSERPDLVQVLGVLGGFGGVSLVIGSSMTGGGGGTAIGISAMLLTALCYACGTIYGRSMRTENPCAIACGQQTCGALVAACLSLAFEAPGSWSQPVEVWIELAAIGILCSALPTALYLRLLTSTSSVSASLVAYLQPTWAMWLGWAVLGERVAAMGIVGTCVILAGVMVTTMTNRS